VTRHSQNHDDDAARGRVRIPADVERPDRILAGLTAHQLVVVAVPAVVLWASFLFLHRWVPLPVFAALAVPPLVSAATLALGQRDGLSLDRLLIAALRQGRQPRRLVPAPDGISLPPAWAGHDPQPAPAPLVLPAHELTDEGVFDLGSQGAAIVCRVVPVNFALRTAAEQQALIGGFGRYLNSLTTPVQILVRSIPVDLTMAVVALREAAGGLPHPALEAAARDHANYLAGLAADRDLLTRDVLLIFRSPDASPDGLQRIGADATTALAGCGLTVTVLDATAASTVLAAAVDPWSAPRPAGMAAADAIITLTSRGGSR
jgi:hypothetical protein